MKTRRRYRDGDEVGLSGGCDGCSPARINGVLCHEAGCPEAWRDHPAECFRCGFDFYRSERFQTICPDCLGEED